MQITEQIDVALRGLRVGAVEATAAVRLEEVTCRLGRRLVLAGISADFAAGEVTGILGSNGAGKSTLLSILIGLRAPTGGSAHVLGERMPARGTALRRRIGVVLQETALYDELTAFENLRFAASLYSVPDSRRRIGEVLETLGLSARSDDVVSRLSGGMRRRVAIARALLHQPELLVIDEPTLGVDVDARHAIWSHIRLLRASGTSVVVATNYLDEAEALCDMVAVLRDGRLAAFEAPASLVARAGRCIDVDCHPEQVAHIDRTLAGRDGVIRIDRTPSGAAVFLDGDTPPDDVLRSVLASGPVGGVRLRAADLAEVFKALATA